MIDLAKIKYRLVVMDENKNQYNIKEYVENLGWEENDGELAVRLSFVAKNDKTSRIPSIADFVPVPEGKYLLSWLFCSLYSSS